MLPTKDDVQRYLDNRQREIDSAVQYRAMAEAEPTPDVARVYERLAAAEERHASFWEKKLDVPGVHVGPRAPSWRARLLSALARRFGPRLVLPAVASREYTDRNEYLSHPETYGTRMTQEERIHARLLERLLSVANGVPGATRARIEGRHRAVTGNALRAAVLGANDGLSSNLSLMMGVAGVTVDSRAILFAGAAGLLGGAFSMSLGAWVSTESVRELSLREIEIERVELDEMPEEEEEELALIYESKGLSPADARELAAKMMKTADKALETLTREELGIDPEDLGGSPWVAALASMLLFAAGAIVPMIPRFFVGGELATFLSLLAGAVGLFVLGAAITLFTGKSALVSGGRQLLLGLGAALATFLIGRAIGVVAT